MNQEDTTAEAFRSDPQNRKPSLILALLHRAPAPKSIQLPEQTAQAEDRPWSRRRFLRGLGAGMGLLAATCGRQPEPTNTRGHRAHPQQQQHPQRRPPTCRTFAPVRRTQ
ncbi:MAG: twin-arginine translocation signal domain-containing protein [Caldilineaceae bacterium]